MAGAIENHEGGAAINPGVAGNTARPTPEQVQAARQLEEVARALTAKDKELTDREATLNAEEPTPIKTERVNQQPIKETKMEADIPEKKHEKFSLKETSKKWGKGIKEFFKKEPVKLGILAGLAGFTALTWNPLFAPLFAGLAVKFPILGSISAGIGNFIKGIPGAIKGGTSFARGTLGLPITPTP